jgi:hypothetical protein
VAHGRISGPYPVPKNATTEPGSAGFEGHRSVLIERRLGGNAGLQAKEAPRSEPSGCRRERSEGLVVVSQGDCDVRFRGCGCTYFKGNLCVHLPRLHINERPRDAIERDADSTQCGGNLSLRTGLVYDAYPRSVAEPCQVTNSPGGMPGDEAGRVHDGRRKACRSAPSRLSEDDLRQHRRNQWSSQARPEPSPGSAMPNGDDPETPRYVESASAPCEFKCSTTVSFAPPNALLRS